MTLSTILRLSPRGHMETIRLEHKRISTHFNGDKISFCGAIPDLNVFAVSRKERCEDDIVNMYSEKFPSIFEKTYGDILLVGSDENGQECDFDIAKVENILQIAY